VSGSSYAPWETTRNGINPGSGVSVTTTTNEVKVKPSSGRYWVPISTNTSFETFKTLFFSLYFHCNVPADTSSSAVWWSSRTLKRTVPLAGIWSQPRTTWLSARNWDLSFWIRTAATSDVTNCQIWMRGAQEYSHCTVYYSSSSSKTSWTEITAFFTTSVSPEYPSIGIFSCSANPRIYIDSAYFSSP